jgi:integrase
VSDRWIKKQLGGVRLRDLGTKRVREWRGGITSAGASPTQANHALSILSAALGCAMRDGALPANPCSGVRKLPVMVARPRALTPAEIEKVIGAMPKQRDRLLVALMGYGGLRPGEAIALRWDDVRDHLLIVDRSYTAGEVRPTKTGSRRTVEIAAPLRDDLDAFRPARPEVGALVCPNRFGTYVDLDNWRRRVWDNATEASGVEATIYDLRHSFCSLLIHEGRSVPYVAATMGHASGVTTLTHYAHLFDEQRLGTAKPMVDAIAEARRGVRNLYAPAEPRRLRQAAPVAGTRLAKR